MQLHNRAIGLAIRLSCYFIHVTTAPSPPRPKNNATFEVYGNLTRHDITDQTILYIGYQDALGRKRGPQLNQPFTVFFKAGHAFHWRLENIPIPDLPPRYIVTVAVGNQGPPPVRLLTAFGCACADVYIP
ncbi:hypothetical protein C2G38_2246126 [Gigaspora rosea]|uniref:Uncharacterized protein n=1 Tax=Gigaspora rosea TaxID=44941 RepID=A0A397V608_9GLOM|nr:hypothetical protein C2G38_2246126 [Gigaspora rosea]